MTLEPALILSVLTIVFNAGVSWAIIRAHITKSNGNGNGNGNGKEKGKVNDLDYEIRGLKVILLGVEGQGGMIADIRDLRSSRHATNNKLQELYNEIHRLREAVTRLEEHRK